MDLSSRVVMMDAGVRSMIMTGVQVVSEGRDGRGGRL